MGLIQHTLIRDRLQRRTDICGLLAFLITAVRQAGLGKQICDELCHTDTNEDRLRFESDGNIQDL